MGKREGENRDIRIEEIDGTDVVLPEGIMISVLFTSLFLQDEQQELAKTHKIWCYIHKNCKNSRMTLQICCYYGIFIDTCILIE